ncbi:hypothetical protein KUTeg_009235 [Tegillarca granosa]|uniref:HTH psq-type domain-containing protein n=1 Tax=Tegillarca granosa TaxID=220873 RepID=A0ABQ9FC10_TEGGR|nr:hypothetical protein KUTeg_009235 [Tegillarca granosa]
MNKPKLCFSLSKESIQFFITEDMKSWLEESMSSAVVEVKGGMSIRKAAKKYSVPKSSLADRVTGKVAEGARWGRRPAFSFNDEKQLIEVSDKRAEMGIGFTKKTFFSFCWRISQSKRNNIQTWIAF